MNATQHAGELARLAGLVQRAADGARLAELAAEGIPHPDAPKVMGAAKVAADAADAAMTGFAAIGVRVRPAGVALPLPIPLELLDTPVARRFLWALEDATDAAEALDRERGRVDSQGEPCGVSERLREWTELVRVETFGAVSGLE